MVEVTDEIQVLCEGAGEASWGVDLEEAEVERVRGEDGGM